MFQCTDVNKAKIHCLHYVHIFVTGVYKPRLRDISTNMYSHIHYSKLLRILGYFSLVYFSVFTWSFVVWHVWIYVAWIWLVPPKNNAAHLIWLSLHVHAHAHKYPNIPNHVWEVYIPFIGPTNPISVRFCFMLLFHVLQYSPRPVSTLQCVKFIELPFNLGRNQQPREH